LEGNLNYLDHRDQRLITDEVRQSVLVDLPELADIVDDTLRDRVVEAWSYALCDSSFHRITDIPGEAGPPGDTTPGSFRLARGTQATHLRGVARIAVAIADDFLEHFPESRIDRDIVIAGALAHDLGKAWELDPVNQSRWHTDGSRFGIPSLRHPVYGAHIGLVVGLPEEIIHICLAHSYEGDKVNRSLECIIVQRADHAWWVIAGASGLLVPEMAGKLATLQISPRAIRQDDVASST
jgi:23S rRNA maturation-related 3'-5' exoribonuclease YhaM